jgi:hypothetical protein
VTLALDQTVREIELAEQQEAEARGKIWRVRVLPEILSPNHEGKSRDLKVDYSNRPCFKCTFIASTLQSSTR